MRLVATGARGEARGAQAPGVVVGVVAYAPHATRGDHRHVPRPTATGGTPQVERRQGPDPVPLPKRAISSAPVVQSMIQSPACARRRVSPIGASRPAVRAQAPQRPPQPPSGRAYLKEVQRILAEVHGVSEQQRATPPPRAHRLGRGGGREVAACPGSPRSGRPMARHRHRGRDQPPERRPVATRLRRLARLFGRDRRAAPADAARGNPAGGDPLREGAAAGVQPGAARRASGVPAARPRCATGRCSTISAGTPTGPTGSPARASRRRTSRGPRASASTRCWSRRRRAGSAPPSGARC